MAQDNREFISKENIRRALLDECKGNVIGFAILGITIVPLMALAVIGLYELLPHVWPLWGLFALVGARLFYRFFIKGLIGALCDRRLIVRGEFHVEQDYARAIDDDDDGLNIWDVLYFLCDLLWLLFLIPAMESNASYIHFSNNRRFTPSKRTRDHTTAGDPFYLVVLNNRKKEIAYVYNARYYRLEE